MVQFNQQEIATIMVAVYRDEIHIMVEQFTKIHMHPIDILAHTRLMIMVLQRLALALNRPHMEQPMVIPIKVHTHHCYRQINRRRRRRRRCDIRQSIYRHQIRA